VVPPEAENSPCTLSVCMITYNHERFIAQAIESVLMQQTDFTFELVIGEDCSIDGTRQIILEYQRKYPKIIRPLFRKANLGMIANFASTLRSCNGEFIAVLEGDDFWTSPVKLQKQVDFLRTHKGSVLSFHRARRCREDGTEVGVVWPSRCDRFSALTDLLAGTSRMALDGVNFIPTCSVVLRNGILHELPYWMYGLGVGDFPFWALLARCGDLAFLEDEMAAYRLHSGGVTHGWNEITGQEITLAAFVTLAEHLKGQHSSWDRAISLGLARRHHALARAYESKCIRRNALQHVVRSILPWRSIESTKAIRLLIKLVFPRMVGRLAQLAHARHRGGPSTENE